MEINKKILLDYFRNENLSDNERVCITNLYKSYININELLDSNDDNINKEVLLDYENKIYTIDGKQLSERQKVELELNRLERIFNEFKQQMTSFEIEKFSDDIIVLNQLFLEYNNDLDEETLDYIKKNISLLQAKLGLKNNFLLAVLELFLEKYKDIYFSKNNTSKNILEKKKK